MELLRIDNKDVKQYIKDMQEAFQFYADEGYISVDGTVLAAEEIKQTLYRSDTIAYKAVLDGQMVGGAIISLDEQKWHGHLELLYVKCGIQSKGVGKFMWFEIEKKHPDIAVWETITPYFAKRNIHFYINVCGFHIVEYFNSHHANPNPRENYDGPDDDFVFRKVKCL